MLPDVTAVVHWGSKKLMRGGISLRTPYKHSILGDKCALGKRVCNSALCDVSIWKPSDSIIIQTLAVLLPAFTA